MIRAKFKLLEMHSFPYSDAKRFIFIPQYDMSIDKHERLTDGTPMGKMELLVDNPEAIRVFTLYKDIEVSFQPII